MEIVVVYEIISGSAVVRQVQIHFLDIECTALVGSFPFEDFEIHRCFLLLTE